MKDLDPPPPHVSALLSRCQTPSVAWHILASSPNHTSRYVAARNCPDEAVLLTLASDRHEDVREAILYNDAKTRSVLDAVIASGGIVAVRASLQGFHSDAESARVVRMNKNSVKHNSMPLMGLGGVFENRPLTLREFAWRVDISRVRDVLRAAGPVEKLAWPVVNERIGGYTLKATPPSKKPPRIDPVLLHLMELSFRTGTLRRPRGLNTDLPLVKWWLDPAGVVLGKDERNIVFQFSPVASGPWLAWLLDECGEGPFDRFMSNPYIDLDTRIGWLADGKAFLDRSGDESLIRALLAIDDNRVKARACSRLLAHQERRWANVRLTPVWDALEADEGFAAEMMAACKDDGQKLLLEWKGCPLTVAVLAQALDALTYYHDPAGLVAWMNARLDEAGWVVFEDMLGRDLGLSLGQLVSAVCDVRAAS